MIDFEIIETPRLLLRAQTPEVFKQVMETYTHGQLLEYFGYDTDDRLEFERLRYTGGQTTFRLSFLYFHLIEKENKKVIGGCGFHTWNTVHHRAEIGYEVFSEPHKNKGFMKEALPVILTYGFNQLNLHRIEALVGPENTPSLKLIKSAGFTQEAVLREHYFVNGVHEDSVMFSLLKSEWPALNS